MAKQIIQKLIDDIDGGDASETVSFSFDGVRYTIDLSEANASALRQALDPYVTAGTRQGRDSGTWRPGITPNRRQSSRVDNKAVREWAADKGHELSGRGRIPQSVLEAYEAAQKAPVAPPVKAAKAPKAAESAPTKAIKQAPRKKPAAVQFKAN